MVGPSQRDFLRESDERFPGIAHHEFPQFQDDLSASSRSFQRQMDGQLLVWSLDAFQAIQTLLPAPCFFVALPCAVPTDEVLGFRDVFLLGIVFLLAPLHAFGPEFQIPVVWRVVRGEAPLRQLKCAPGHAFQEIAVVRDDDEGSFEFP